MPDKNGKLFLFLSSHKGFGLINFNIFVVFIFGLQQYVLVLSMRTDQNVTLKF
jgi:hypothetical protein